MKNILFILIITFLSFCNNNKIDNKIVGTWTFQKDNKNVNEQIVFEKDKTFFSQTLLNGKIIKGYIMNYEIINNGKVLISTDDSGKTEEIEIIELTSSSLKMRRKNTKNTVELLKQ